MLSGNRELKPAIPAHSRLKCGEEKNMDINARQSPAAEVRLTSLDFFRGLTMFMLIGEATGLYELFREPALNGTLLSAIGWQLDHHPWNGLRCWDLVQPFFMFIVGVAMPFSIGKRWQRGDSWRSTLHHVLIRSSLLLLFGWALYCIGPGRLTFELWNVLAQLSFTYLVAFLMMRKSAGVQLGFTFMLLIVTELLYRLWPVAGFNQPFVPDHGFGAWVDLMIMHKLSAGHWVAFNAVPTTAHTMWGVLAGQVLKSSRAPLVKIRILTIAGLIGVVSGYALNPLTPIIKRICTSSFVIVSGGWCLLALALSYWLIDVKGYKRWGTFFNIVGTNSLFIYLFTNTGGAEWFRKIARPFVMGMFAWGGQLKAEIVVSLVVWGMLWYLCLWLYRNRIFIKI
jgi:predicted acyltransferase